MFFTSKTNKLTKNFEEYFTLNGFNERISPIFEKAKQNMDDRTKALQALAAKRWRISLILSGAMMFIYFAFILLIAFNKPLMGSLVLPGLSLGILLGALVIISAWILIFIYVRWANNHYDDKIALLTRK